VRIPQNVIKLSPLPGLRWGFLQPDYEEYLV
jgi:hypothetical protein